MAGYKFTEEKGRTRLWLVVVLFTLITLALSYSFLVRTPPQHFVLATGQPGGAYDSFGQEYQKRLSRLGLNVELLQTAGSVDNLERVKNREADVAFVQGGTAGLVEDPEKSLRGLVTIYLEPLWVFHRGKENITNLALFKGKKISIGPKRSGTEAVSDLLLKAHGIDAKNATLLNMSGGQAEAAMLEGTIDVAFMVSSYRDQHVTELLRSDQVQLMNFRREVAYNRQFPYLSAVKLAEGILDLNMNIPSEDKTLLAPSAMLVCRADLDPRVAEQILKVAQALHASGSLIDAPLRFPSLEGMDLRVHEAAETYIKSGESFLSRLLPYWGVRLVYLMRVLLLPVLLLWLPFLKLLPWLYSYRVNQLLKKHYAALRELEGPLSETNDVATLRAGLKDLDSLASNMASVSGKVPANLQPSVYQWRTHVALVRAETIERLRRLGEDPKGYAFSAEMMSQPDFSDVK